MPDYSGKKVLIMGYGLNEGGSGPQAARYLACKGADLTITDLRTADILAPTMGILDGFQVRWVLGHHNISDFQNADIVVKNPGVNKDSPFLADVKQIETDLSLFLQEKQPNLIAVTGSKGKSSISSLIYHVLKQVGYRSHLGGNISVSPLTFVDDVENTDTVILEISSWQSGDLLHLDLLKPKVSLITNLFNDHQNYYQNDMEAYALDKAAVCLEQTEDDWTVLNLDDDWTSFFCKHTKAQIAYFSCSVLDKKYPCGAYLNEGNIVLRKDGKEHRLKLNNDRMLPQNLMTAALVLYLYGLEISAIEEGVRTFKGIRHRLQPVLEKQGVRYYNDSAATIPIAAVASIQHFAPKARKLHVIFGGSDKELDFVPMKDAFPLVASWHVFEGTALPKIQQIFKEYGQSYYGPFKNMEDIIASAAAQAQEGDIVLMSPGCTSFGLFLNEFDRGNQFIEIMKKEA